MFCVQTGFNSSFLTHSLSAIMSLVSYFESARSSQTLITDGSSVKSCLSAGQVASSEATKQSDELYESENISTVLPFLRSSAILPQNCGNTGTRDGAMRNRKHTTLPYRHPADNAPAAAFPRSKCRRDSAHRSP